MLHHRNVKINNSFLKLCEHLLRDYSRQSCAVKNKLDKFADL